MVSFLKRCFHDRLYPYRKFRWQVLQLFPETTLRSHTKHGYLSYSSRDQTIGKDLHLLKEFDFSTILWCLEFLNTKNVQPNSRNILLDIGANIGTACIPLMTRGAFTFALAFEPELKNYELLSKNIKLNGLQARVSPIRIGLSSKNQESLIYKSSKNFGDHRVLCANQEFLKNREPAPINLRRLDSFVTQEKIHPKDIGFILLDTQGHDLEVLKGGTSVLSHSPPLLMEIWPEGILANGSNSTKVTELLAPNYRKYYDFRFNPPKLNPISELTKLWNEVHQKNDYCNVLFI